jgi:hypothetical protein
VRMELTRERRPVGVLGAAGEQCRTALLLPGETGRPSMTLLNGDR